MKQILPARKERLDLLGRNIFGKDDGIAAFEEWLAEVGMKLRLRDLGCELERAVLSQEYKQYFKTCCTGY
jgi:hypothetical protein